jgi:hypothetical protein
VTPSIVAIVTRLARALAVEMAELIGPKMRPGFGTDQLSIHSHPIAALK